MGLGQGISRWMNRGRVYTVTDTQDVSFGETFTITGPPLLGPDWAAGVSLYQGLMQIPGAWRGMNLIADLIGQCDWDAYRDLEHPDRVTDLVWPRPLLLEQPSPPYTRMATLASAALDFIAHGNAIGVFASYNAAGQPTSVAMVPAERAQVRRIGYQNDSPLPFGTIEYVIGGYSFTPDQVLHVMGPHQPGALRGVGVLEAHLGTLQLSQEQSRQARQISAAGVPTGTLKATSPDVTPAELALAKAGWLASQRDRTIAALSPSVDFQPLAWNPTDMQMIEARKFSLTEWELILGLPDGFLSGEGKPMHYTSDESSDVKLLKFSLNGHLVRFSQELSRHFSRGTVVRPNVDEAILRSATKERFTSYQLADAWMQPNERRARERLDPIPGLDEAWLAAKSGPAAPAQDVTPPDQLGVPSTSAPTAADLMAPPAVDANANDMEGLQ